jgi:hypothetical protein
MKNKIWSIIWMHWLWNPIKHRYNTVIKVKGWRTAVIEDGDERSVMSPCFWIFD